MIDDEYLGDSSPYLPPAPPPLPSPADIVSNVIKQAKAEITAKQAKKQAKQDRTHDNIEGVLNGLSKLREESNRAFEYTIQEQTPNTLKVTTNLKGRFSAIKINGNSKFTKKSGIAAGKIGFYESLDWMLADATKKAIKQGLVRP